MAVVCRGQRGLGYARYLWRIYLGRRCRCLGPSAFSPMLDGGGESYCFSAGGLCRYKIEPFFFSSSLNWIPSRYQEDLRPHQSDRAYHAQHPIPSHGANNNPPNTFPVSNRHHDNINVHPHNAKPQYSPPIAFIQLHCLYEYEHNVEIDTDPRPGYRYPGTPCVEV